MINFDKVTRDETHEHNPCWPQIAGHLHRIVKVGESGSGKWMHCSV